MPYLKLSSNVRIEAEQNTLLIRELSAIVARETRKPERFVMITIEHQAYMLFAGDAQPLAYLECKSIGLGEQQAQHLSAALCALLHERLGIAAERVYIEFSNCPAAFWGWNGDTFG
jgi:phenylpyruvate tautomerase